MGKFTDSIVYGTLNIKGVLSVEDRVEVDSSAIFKGDVSAPNFNGVATKVSNPIVIRLNGGTVEGNSQHTFNGQESKSINITPNSIGAVASNGVGASGTWGISISGNAASASVLQTPRTLSIGNASKAFNGGANVVWTLNEIGAAPSNHVHYHINNRGKIAVSELGSTYPSGISMSESYNNGYPTMYGNVLTLKGDGDTQLLMEWSGGQTASINDITTNMYVRSRRDNISTWTTFSRVCMFGQNIGTSSTNYAAGNHTHTFASLTSKPTTISGYGITDAPTKTGGGASGTWGISISGNAATASSVAWGNVSGKPTTISGYGITDAPTKTGGGASGTWGISISGNAATASSVAWGNVSGKPNTLGGYGITDAPTKTGGGASGTWGISISGNAAVGGRLSSASIQDLNAPNWGENQVTFQTYNMTAANKPYTNNNANGVINFSFSKHGTQQHFGFQLAQGNGSNRLYFRQWSSNGPSTWETFAYTSDVLNKSHTTNQLEAFTSGNFTGGNHYLKAIRLDGWTTRLYMGYHKDDTRQNSVHVYYADNSGNSNTVGGLSVHTGRNNEANKIVRTSGNGYLEAGWINTTSGGFNSGNERINKIYCSDDDYIRHMPPDEFKRVLGLWHSGNLNPSAFRWYDGWLAAPGYDANTIAGSKSGFSYSNNCPNDGTLIHFDSGGYGLQISSSYCNYGTNKPYNFHFRTRDGDGKVWNSWYMMYNNGNLNNTSTDFTCRNITVAGSVNQTSSIEFKTNIREFNNTALDIIEKVKIVEYNYKTDLDTNHIGFIAENTPKELSSDAQNVMDVGSCVGVLLKAVQELTTKCDRYERLLSTLVDLDKQTKVAYM